MYPILRSFSPLSNSLIFNLILHVDWLQKLGVAGIDTIMNENVVMLEGDDHWNSR